MNLLFAATELSPYAKTGGLADVLAALPAALRHRGHSVACVLPLFRSIRETLPGLRPTDLVLHAPLGTGTQSARIWEGRTDRDIRLFLVEKDEFFDRTYLYGPPGKDYADNASRFFFFSKIIPLLAQHIRPAPQILHLHDWHTGLVPAYIRAGHLPFRTVFTIHNLAYQGHFWGLDFPLTNLPPDYFSPAGIEFHQHINCLKAAIVFADRLTTVSPRYAQEIQTEEFGCGLADVLRLRKYKLTGILNGADYSRWDPRNDPALPVPYSASNLSGKQHAKDLLAKQLGWAPFRTPLFCAISRLTEQKGIPLLLEIRDELMKEEGRLVVLGEGDPELQERLRNLARELPDRIQVRIGFDEAFAHLLTAAADFLLMPSLFEPCGLTQLHALRYGTLPIAHETGGLADTILPWDPETRQGTGFLFQAPTASAFADAVKRAKTVYRDPPSLRAMRQAAMRQEFSWDRSAAAYEELYRQLAD
ncbi:starch synthase [Methylacidimicrobium cyclopophantes]|uniref:Glycogen synthase n=1 Tax=Methylacidimicrobium cyclopophantes TaxID=1041766 RepID=A0A5E6MH81_9BACT|nr:glycogen synthase GlgA [Methylacidimicrobium cyclopophantes]VVM07247.1 starch synthase [Methylacidimicrobium cyclopophantes]